MKRKDPCPFTRARATRENYPTVYHTCTPQSLSAVFNYRPLICHFRQPITAPKQLRILFGHRMSVTGAVSDYPQLLQAGNFFY